jgi:hypothetical protein
MKKLLAAFMMLCAVHVFAFTEPEVNKKTVEAFSIIFKDAVDITWYAEENYDQVYFYLHNIKTQIKYNKDGSFVSCFRTYKCDNLPLFIQMKLKNEFAKRNITSVAELSTGETIEYHLVMEDDKFWYNVKSDALGNFTVDKKFRKG